MPYKHVLVKTMVKNKVKTPGEQLGENYVVVKTPGEKLGGGLQM